MLTIYFFWSCYFIQFKPYSNEAVFMIGLIALCVVDKDMSQSLMTMISDLQGICYDLVTKPVHIEADIR